MILGYSSSSGIEFRRCEKSCKSDARSIAPSRCRSGRKARAYAPTRRRRGPRSWRLRRRTLSQGPQNCDRADDLTHQTAPQMIRGRRPVFRFRTVGGPFSMDGSAIPSTMKTAGGAPRRNPFSTVSTPVFAFKYSLQSA